MPAPHGACVDKSNRDYDDAYNACYANEQSENVNNVNMMLTISTKVTSPSTARRGKTRPSHSSSRLLAAGSRPTWTTEPVVAKCGVGHFTDMQAALPRDMGGLTPHSK